MNDKWYIVDDLNEFVLATRKLLFNNFGKAKEEQSPDIDEMLDIQVSDEEEFNTVLTQEESIIIAKGLMRKQSNYKTKAIRYLVTDAIYMQILEDMNSRMVSNILNSLVSKGLLESGFDTESNDFVFWIKEDEKKTEAD